MKHFKKKIKRDYLKVDTRYFKKLKRRSLCVKTSILLNIGFFRAYFEENKKVCIFNMYAYELVYTF